MRFTKMHGIGNDYVYVDCFQEPLPTDTVSLARQVSDRRFGVGGDGLILIRPSEIADARMQMFNADGSEAQMCGNGIRCVAKYVYDQGIVRSDTIAIETGNGVLAVEVRTQDGLVEQVKVDMGEPILEASRIPTTLSGAPVVDCALKMASRSVDVTCVSMGNPHCVVFVEKATDEWVLGVGPSIETDSRFPERINVEFVEVQNKGEVCQRTWERGSGETWACGTGASAVCVAGVLSGRTGRKILNHLRGGDLEIEWSELDNHVYMTGPATTVFTGEWLQ
ncbi:MAG: diaminopimelate epimerase [Planctomycetaceae bacterium]|nr:diaminopimelate epimerase [Planctomycetaceae bacterium]